MAQQAPAAAAAAIGAAPPRRVACIAGFGVAGISAATARRFGSAGYDVALLARREDRLQIGAEELRAAGACGAQLRAGPRRKRTRATPRAAQVSSSFC